MSFTDNHRSLVYDGISVKKHSTEILTQTSYIPVTRILLKAEEIIYLPLRLFMCFLIGSK